MTCSMANWSSVVTVHSRVPTGTVVRPLPGGEVRGERLGQPAGEVVQGAAHRLLAQRAQLLRADAPVRAGGQAAFEQRPEPVVVAVQTGRALGGVGDPRGESEGAAVAVGVTAGGGDGGDQADTGPAPRRLSSAGIRRSSAPAATFTRTCPDHPRTGSAVGLGPRGRSPTTGAEHGCRGAVTRVSYPEGYGWFDSSATRRPPGIGRRSGAVRATDAAGARRTACGPAPCPPGSGRERGGSSDRHLWNSSLPERRFGQG